MHVRLLGGRGRGQGNCGAMTFHFQIRRRLPRRRADAPFRTPMRASRVAALSCGNGWLSPGRSGSKRLCYRFGWEDMAPLSGLTVPPYGEKRTHRDLFYRDCGATIKRTLFLKFETVIQYVWTYARQCYSAVHAFHLPACPPVTLV
jgi:hypothetical protein